MSAVQRPSSRTAVSDFGPSVRHKPSSSVSSNVSHSRSDAEGRRDTKRSGVETSVTRLLVSIKKLLEGLTDWSNHQVSDMQISDMYVRFGNDFNAAVIAFDSFAIDMGELKRVPDDLRDILERCLAEEASPENLNLYLPSVRKIITHLLEGLRRKQDEYRLREGSSTRSNRSSRTELPYHDSGQTEETATPASPPPSVRSSSFKSSRSVTPTAGDSMRSRRPADPRRGPSVSDTERRTNSSSRSSGIPVPPVPQDGGPRTSQFPRSSSQKRNQVSRSASGTPAPPDTDSEPSRTKSGPRAARQGNLTPSTSPPAPNGDISQASRPDSIRATIPPEMPRYSLQDTPMPSVAIEVSSPTSPQETPASDVGRPGTPDTPSTPAVESSLAALKQSEALQRRASKRFSSYTMSKMAGAAIGPSPGPSNNLRRSVATGAMLTNIDLAALTEGDEGAEDPVTPQPRNKELGRKRSIERRTRAPTLDEATQPPVPSLPSSSDTQQPKPVNGIVSHTPVVTVSAPANEERPDSPREIMVYFQVGRQVKKVTMEPATSFAALRVLFMNKFMYNPGQDNFPEIYIRDPASGVQYELEDVSEVKDRCLLSLNIEPLDQIKQHIDIQIASISQEINDLKTSVATSRRMSLNAAPSSPGLSNSAAMVSRPTERQFQSMAQRIGKARSATAVTPIAPQLTGTSDVGSVASSRIVADLKNQFDEVQNIRRDLGVMRQIYVDFTNSTKESLAALRTQTNAVRQVANTKVGGARASIDSGKARLDKRSQDVLTEIEDLQDTVENLKDDVLKRHVTPKLDAMRRLRSKIDSTTKELNDLKTHITTIKPSWKKTWEQELQNIVEEQQFLGHQEELIEDLIEDHKALVEVFGHVEKVISIRGSGAMRSRSFRPLPPEDGNSGLSTLMMEIRGAETDSDRRLKAIQQSQAARKKELDSRGDEFQEELHGFVAGKKLKKTGGAEEVERIRQRKDGMAFKAMFAGGGSIPGGGGGSPGAMGGGGFAGGLPGLAMAPAMDSDSDYESPPET